MTNETDVTEVVAAPATAPLPRARADWWGHAALSAANALGTAISGLARLGGAAAAWAWRLAQTVPPGVRGFGLAAVGMLLGVVGAVALHNIAGVVCTVVVIPVCASVLGALAYRWYGGAAASGLRVGWSFHLRAATIGRVRRSQAGAGADVIGYRAPPAGGGGTVSSQDRRGTDIGNRAGQPQL